MPVLKRNSARVFLAAFDEAAVRWGWERDQGYGASVVEAEEAYLMTKSNLILYFNRVLSEKGES